MAYSASQKFCLKFLKNNVNEFSAGLADSNIFISVCVAQKSIESGYGKSTLARCAQNFGGIKGRPIYSIGLTTGGYCSATKASIPRGYAIFPSMKDSIMSYASFLKTVDDGNRYKKAFLQTNAEDQLWEIIYAGYCTSRLVNGRTVIDGNQKANADYYLKTCRPYLDVLADFGIGGKILSKDRLAYIQNVQNVDYL